MMGFWALWRTIRTGDHDRVSSARALHGTSMAVARPEVANWVPNPDGEAAMKTPSQPTHVVDRPGLKRKLAQWARTRPQLRSWLELINQEPRNDHVILDPSP
jgi:hypothetical protein